MAVLVGGEGMEGGRSEGPQFCLEDASEAKETGGGCAREPSLQRGGVKITHSNPHGPSQPPASENRCSGGNQWQWVVTMGCYCREG